MKLKRNILILATILAATACVDNESIDGTIEGVSSQEQPVVAIPEFRIGGIENLPESLVVTGIDLAVSEIRFAPVVGDELAYSTNEPMEVSFDIESGVNAVAQGPVELPEPGRYIVSLRLEPAEGNQFVNRSFALNGYVAEAAAGMVGEEKSDGTPQPILFDEEEELIETEYATRRDGSSWTPFKYESRRSVFFTFNDVQLEHGEQFLVFNFNAANWGVAALDSIKKGVRNTAHETSKEVDVTKTLESNGDDFQGLLETGSVNAHGGV